MLFYAREPARELLAHVVVGAVVVWALMALLGEHGLPATGGVLGATLSVELRGRRQFGTWANRRAVAGAVLDQRDPGPDYRPTVERAARNIVIERVVAQLFVWLFFGGLGVACLVTAFVHGDWALGCAAIALLGCTTCVAVVMGRAVGRARAWLADPPATVPTADQLPIE
jgi:hypothetical protein